jgi:uncharacterized membrane protein YsdA (DUF1294 family)
MAVNALTAFAFRSDKLRAIEGRRRIREATLLQLALTADRRARLSLGECIGTKRVKSPFPPTSC